MNARLQLQTLAIKDWLLDAAHQLASVGIPSPSLDAEVILASSINCSRTFLHAHPERALNIAEIELANRRLKLRLERMPIAYILGHKEFYGRDFIVSPDTLIPRPESEAVIEILAKIIKNLINKQNITLIDVGAGSGCLGITAKLEFPNINVILSDISAPALNVASQNAKKLSADITLTKNDLLEDCKLNLDIIVANLPYVDHNWERSPETNFEPSLALFADDNGTALIKKLIVQASKLLKSDGHLIIEADPTQHDQIINDADKHSFKTEEVSGYIIDLIKIKPQL